MLPRDRQHESAGGFSLIELVLVVATILVIAAIAVPNLLKARTQANEAAAVVTMRSVQSSQSTYSIMYPQVGYASTMGKLGPPPPGAVAGPEAADLLPADLACPNQPCAKSGYEFEITVSDDVPASIYYVKARPIIPLNTGTKIYRLSSNDNKVAHEAVEVDIKDKQ